MNQIVLDIDNAYLALKEGLVIIDMNKNYFKLSNKTIIIRGDNVRYSLEIKEFLDLYKNSKFVVVDFNDESIDLKKDEEYYSFKHK